MKQPSSSSSCPLSGATTGESFVSHKLGRYSMKSHMAPRGQVCAQPTSTLATFQERNQIGGSAQMQEGWEMSPPCVPRASCLPSRAMGRRNSGPSYGSRLWTKLLVFLNRQKVTVPTLQPNVSEHGAWNVEGPG